MTHSPIPLFLFSLPRSGSTLIQRILGADPAVATAAEPHLLLPVVYAMRDHGLYAEYNHRIVSEAIEDFCALLPRGQEDYLSEVVLFTTRLYAKASGPDTKYFFDKTPRYHLIADEICRMFENGRFIFLWRNPLAIAASMLDSFCGGKWHLHRYKIDLFDGLQNLIGVYQRHEKRACSIKYEDVIADPETLCRKVYDYLDLPFDPNVLSAFNGVLLKGRRFDRIGPSSYQSISSQPLVKWKSTLASPFRKAWCRRYLKWIGQERLAVMGYKLDALMEELDSIPSNYQNLISDLYRASRGVACCALEPRIIEHKARLLPSWHRVHTHLCVLCHFLPSFFA